MKKLYISLALLVAATLTSAQTPTISMTTTLSINSQISFSIRGSSASTPIQIDWGNGVIESYTIGNSDEAFGFPVKGSTIKIWGQGVEGFNIQSKELTALEFYQATSFKTLLCKGNKLTTLNLGDCSALTLVECKQNLISSLTLPSTATLTYVDCSDNNLTLASLPIKQGTWTDYIYSPQKNYTLTKTVYAVNEEIDLSSQLTINSNTTSYTWKTAGGTTLVNGVDYNVSGGKFTFLKTYSESLYCEMANASFPSLTLKTISISIPTLPAVVLTTTTAIGSTFSFTIAATANSTPIHIDWGNGILANYTIGVSYSNISGTLAGNIIKIYGAGIYVLELSAKNITGLDISGVSTLRSLNCNSNQLTSLDVTKNTVLTILYCSRNQLSTLDVTKNTALTILDCYSNQLTTIDVSKNTALTNLDCFSNKLTTLDVSTNTALTNLDCNWNKLTTLDVSKNTALINLDYSSNQLTTLDVSKNTALTILDCSSNQLTTLDISKNTALTYLDCVGNQLTTLDVSTNIALTYLHCGWNKLTTFDISTNTALTYLNGNSNKLTTIDVTKNTALTILDCSYNKLTSIDITKNTLLTNLDCDNNTFTNLDVTKNTALTSLYCNNNQLTIGTLPINQPTWTTYTYSPQATLKLSKSKYSINEEIDLSSQLTANGNTTTYTWKTTGGITLVKNVDYTELNGKFTFPTAQGDYLYCQMTNATFPDLTLTTETISIPSASPTVTMTTNTSVGSTFSFGIAATAYSTPIQVDWGNGTLTDYNIDKSSSNISSSLSGNTIKIYGVGISFLQLASKNLTALDISGATALTSLFCYSNELEVLDVSKNIAMTSLYCYSNKLAALNVSKNTALTWLYCSSNQLTLSSLPIKQSAWTTYTYSPQAAMVLPKKNYTLSETLDISSQLTVNSNTTNYVWKTKGGTALTSGIDYSITNGVTTFLKVPTDSVYCQMTNATFPDLTLSTTNVKVTQFPVSIDETSLTINIYPNPVRESLNIELNENIAKVEVYSIIGAKIYEKAGDNALTMAIPTAELPKGLLIVKVYGRNGVMERKIIKE